MKKILDKIERQIADNLYPGASLAIYRNGVWSDYFLGTQDGETPVFSGLAYDLASVSKVVGVASVCAFFLKAGALELDKSLNCYYPAFQNDKVSLRQLLTHTTGIDPFIPNRDRLSLEELKAAINGIRVTDQKGFLYTDVNFILLGFMLEEIYGKPLAVIFQEEIFQHWGMTETSFGPLDQAVPTAKGAMAGLVHDPKARVLGSHAGSAGLFSTLEDLKIFCQHYLEDDFAQLAWKNISTDKPRSIGWNLDGNWIDHTGYTGTYLAINHKHQTAAIFLTNRTYFYDDRALWIEKRSELIAVIQEVLERAL